MSPPASAPAWARGTTGCVFLIVLGIVAAVLQHPLAWLGAAALALWSMGAAPVRLTSVRAHAHASEATVERSQVRVAAAIGQVAERRGFIPSPLGEGWLTERGDISVEFHTRPPDNLELLDPHSDAARDVPGGFQPTGWRLTVRVPALSTMEGVVARPTEISGYGVAVLVGPPAWRRLYHCSGTVGGLWPLLLPGTRPVIDGLLDQGACVGRGHVELGSSALARAPDRVEQLLDGVLSACAELTDRLAPGPVQLLRDALSDHSLPRELRRNLATAIGSVGHNDGMAAGALAAAMNDPDQDVALEAVGRYGGSSDGPLVAAATDLARSPIVRATAMWRLASRKTTHPAAASTAEMAWADGDVELRCAALQLGGLLQLPAWSRWLGTAGRVTAPALLAPPTIRSRSTPANSLGRSRMEDLLDRRHGVEGVATIVPEHELNPPRDPEPTSAEAHFDANTGERRLAHAAAYALRRYATPEHVGVAIDYLLIPSRSVRRAAIEVVLEHGTVACVRELTDVVATGALPDDEADTVNELILAIQSRSGGAAGAVSIAAEDHSGAVSLADDRR